MVSNSGIFEIYSRKSQPPQRRSASTSPMTLSELCRFLHAHKKSVDKVVFELKDCCKI